MSEVLPAIPFANASAARYREGASLITGAVVVWSLAGPLARWVTTDAWTTLFWRSVFAALFLVAYLSWRRGKAFFAAFRCMGREGVAMGVCFGLSMICFINALAMTTVAAVLLFQAASPLLAAAMARLCLGERVSTPKLIAILISFAGVLVIVSGSSDLGSLSGNLLSLVMVICFAGSIVLARAKPDVPTTEASTLGVAIVALVSAPFALLHVSAPDFALLAVFGFGQMGLALIMFAAGVRLIPAADAGLISVLESTLGPVLVWAIFGEIPDDSTLVGGAIVVVAVLAGALLERTSRA